MPAVTAEMIYGYVPSRVTAMVFVIAFGSSFLLHTGQALAYRTRWLLSSLCMCALLEASGWGGRVWSTYVPSSTIAFSIQNANLLLAPTNLLMANFRIFAEIVKILGTSYGMLTPKWYNIVFGVMNGLTILLTILGGVVSMVVKTPVGLLASHNLVLTGMILQLVVVLGFSGYIADYLLRYHNEGPKFKSVRDEFSIETVNSMHGRYTRNLKTMTYALTFTNALLFIRTIYRLAALSDSPNGDIVRSELDLSVFDGALMLLVMHTFNVFHPGNLLPAPKLDPRSPA